MNVSRFAVLGSIVLCILLAVGKASAGELLYNGIQLPDVWPPRASDFHEMPRTPGYLASPPEVIAIDVGRQLFVDDFLIQQTTLQRTYHRPEYVPDNPLLKPDRPWEFRGKAPFAAPFSDGVWFDSQDGVFKMWYCAGHSGNTTCYATSKDGRHWEKPSLDIVPGTNIVLEAARDSSTVWIDPQPRDPTERFKMALYHGTFLLYRSADGIHWSKVSDGGKPPGDRNTFFYNPFRKMWVYSIRSSLGTSRTRHYWETPEFFAFNDAAVADAVEWTGADKLDPSRDDLQNQPQLYNLDCVGYESLLLGLFTIWRGDYRWPGAPTEKAKELQAAGRSKQNSVCVGFSRDGFHWDRADRQPFLPVSETKGDWNWGNVQSAAPGCLVVGDQLWFYVSGRAGKCFPGCDMDDGGATTGLAALRRDGFASMDATSAPGTLTTRPLSFRGSHLFVNLDAPDGELRVEILDAQGRPIGPYGQDHCRPVRGNSTRQAVTWEGADDLAALTGKPVQLRFHLSRGSLYAFWMTPDSKGASYGYVGGGGPGLRGWTDVPGSD